MYEPPVSTVDGSSEHRNRGAPGSTDGGPGGGGRSGANAPGPGGDGGGSRLGGGGPPDDGLGRTRGRGASWVPAIASAVVIFLVMASYYVIRAIRDEVFDEHQHDGQQLWRWVFFDDPAATEIYTAIVPALPRRWVVPIVYTGLAACLLGFWGAFLALHAEPGLVGFAQERSDLAPSVRVAARMAPSVGSSWLEKAFYVFMSVFPLFATSAFWGLMADRFGPGSSHRLFGPIAAGASIGGIVGPWVAIAAVGEVGRLGLLFVAAVGLLATIPFLWPIVIGLPEQGGDQTARRGALRRRLGGSWIGGLRTVIASPYLLGIGAFIVVMTLGSTFLYFIKGDVARTLFEDREQRAAFYARVDLSTNLGSVVVQLVVAGLLVRLSGVGRTLAILPGLTAVGYAILAAVLWLAIGHTPLDELTASAARTVLVALVAFEVMMRMARYGLAKPSREMLFTTVGLHEKYQAKPFLDTVVYRGGDVANSTLYGWLAGLGLGWAALAGVAAPLSALGVGIALVLGVAHRRRSGAGSEWSERPPPGGARTAPGRAAG